MSLRESFSVVLAEYRAPRRWLAVLAIALPVVIVALWFSYFATSLGLLDRADFSPRNPSGFLRGVLLWFALILFAIPPFMIFFEVLVRWFATARVRSLIAIGVSASAVCLVGLLWIAEILAADRCLDRGGSFNYLTAECDQKSSHLFIPFKKRHPFVSLAAVGCGLFGLAVGIQRTREKRAV